MPRVYTYTTRARKKSVVPHRCIKCGQDILPGQKRYEWSFRYGGTYRQHVECGYPSRSQLTQSKMAAVYDALDQAVGDTQEDIAAYLQAAAETVDEVATEYADAAEAFGGAGENQDRADELQRFAQDLESRASDVQSEQPEEGEDEEAFIDRLKTLAEEAAGECPY